MKRSLSKNLLPLLQVFFVEPERTPAVLFNMRAKVALLHVALVAIDQMESCVVGDMSRCRS
jgi:hypothetical protein